jgi:hypothetical protein
MQQDEPAPKPERMGKIEEPSPVALRPDNVGDFTDAVMAAIVSRFGEVEKSWRRRITAASTKGFTESNEVAEVIDAFVVAHPGRFFGIADTTATEEPAPESVQEEALANAAD